MVAYKYTIPAEICGKVEEYVKKRFRGDRKVFVQSQFDDEILLVAESREACRGITYDIETICTYEGVKLEHEMLKDD
jgi:hypothetical protein